MIDCFIPNEISHNDLICEPKLNNFDRWIESEALPWAGDGDSTVQSRAIQHEVTNQVILSELLSLTEQVSQSELVWNEADREYEKVIVMAGFIERTLTVEYHTVPLK